MSGGWSGGTAVSPAQLAQYARWLGHRFQSKGNLIWILGGDEEISVQTDATKAPAAALTSADPNHLISYHPRSQAFELRTEPWLGFNSFQWNANSPPYTYQSIRQGFFLTPTKPILDAEPAYDPSPCCGEDHVTTPLKVRRNGWWAMLSGAMGVVYGGPRGTWNIGASGAPDWVQIQRPAAVHTGNIRKILEPLPWSRLVPDFGNTAAGGGGSGAGTNYVATAVADDGSMIAAYTPGTPTLWVDLPKLSGPGTAQWFDPDSGLAQGPLMPVENVCSKIFTTPGLNHDKANDWVIIVRARKQDSTGPKPKPDSATSDR